MTEVVRHEDGRWVQGASGNPSGRPRKGEAVSDLLRSSLDEVRDSERRLAEKEGREPRTNREILKEILWSRVYRGDLKAIEIVLNRIEGKPKAQVQVQGRVEHGGKVEHDHKHTARLGGLLDKMLYLRERHLGDNPQLEAGVVDVEVVGEDKCSTSD